MYRSTFLSPSHYAGKWIIPEKDQHNDLREVNLLGYAYATAPDGPEKEQKLLLVLEKFHGYLMKYLCMIVRGTLPPANSYAGRDSIAFLRFLARKKAEPSKALTDSTCKTLHLAFKQQSTEEIYDTLVYCFMKAARKYDPYYADKTRTVCEVISELQETQFTNSELEERVGFDCLGICRALVKRGFLASIKSKKKVVGYTKGPKWPAPQSFFQSGPIGFVYVLQIWFRCYFKEHISEQMDELESNDGLLQLGDIDRGHGGSNSVGGHGETLQANAEGNCLNATGTFRFMADRTLMDAPLDVSSLNLAWVSSTTDPMFTDLTVHQRMLLYLHFFEEQNFKTMGKSFGVKTVAMEEQFDAILDLIRYEADLPE